jgi:hypothetical protein
MNYATDVASLLNWFATKQSHDSEFMCAVCGEVFKRNIEVEFENLTFNTDKTAIGVTVSSDSVVGLVWTCSERCKVTYTLQRA